MQYTIKEKEFKGLGYTFQNINHKVYWKDIEQYRIWCWVRGKRIEIDDFYGASELFINYFEENKNNPEVVVEFALPGGKPDRWIPLRYNDQTKEILSLEKLIAKLGAAYWESKYARGGIYREVNLYIEPFQRVVDEIKKIRKDVK